MPPKTVWAELPPLWMHVLAETANGGILNVPIPNGHSPYGGSIELDRTQVDFLKTMNPVGSGIFLPAPKAIDVSTIPKDWGGAGYYQTDVRVVVKDYEIPDIYDRLTAALRIGESWGWSNTLAKTKGILTSPLPWLLGVDAFALPINLLTQYFGPPLGTTGVTFISPDWVQQAPNDQSHDRDLAWTLIHESIHHALFSKGYNVEQSHLATGLAFIMNIATLGMNVDPSKWDTQGGRRPSEGYQLPSPTKNPTSAPDLRAKSVVDTWHPLHQAFGQRLDSIASIMGQWGIGGWVDTYGPPLNYTTSGVSPSADELVLNLVYPDHILGWTIVVRAMSATANAWVISGKLKNNQNVIERATGMGLTALLNRIGLLS